VWVKHAEKRLRTRYLVDHSTDNPALCWGLEELQDNPVASRAVRTPDPIPIPGVVFFEISAPEVIWRWKRC